MTIHDAHGHFFSEGFFGALAKERAGGGTPEPVAAITGSLGWDAPGEHPLIGCSSFVRTR